MKALCETMLKETTNTFSQANHDHHELRAFPLLHNRP